MRKNIQITAGTNLGLVRLNNEDNFIVNPNLDKDSWTVPETSSRIDLGRCGCLLVVADGMGGANAGEVASAIAVDTVRKLFTDTNLETVLATDDSVKTFIEEVIAEANSNIVSRAEQDSGTRGMGTTIVMVWVTCSKAYVAWCGDSRAYVYNAATGLTRLSKDHSYVQQLVDEGKLDSDDAMHHPYSNVITRCLGDSNGRAIPDFHVHDIVDGDCFLLCSDGLHGLCTDRAISYIIETCGDDLVGLRDNLIQAALDAGGDDNVTVALCSVKEVADADSVDGQRQERGVYKSHRGRTRLWYVLLLVLLLAIAAASAFYTGMFNTII